MSPKRIPAGGDQPSQTTPPAQPPAGKQPTTLVAEPIKGKFASGLHGRGKCRLTSKGKPVPYADIDWYVGDHGTHLGTSQTDDKGWATMEYGSISDITTSVEGEISGYSVEYSGDEQYSSSQALGHIDPLFGLS